MLALNFSVTQQEKEESRILGVRMLICSLQTTGMCEGRVSRGKERGGEHHSIPYRGGTYRQSPFVKLQKWPGIEKSKKEKN